MPELLDPTDRDICAALLRNGRASWRLIAQATGLQERTVARRATRLFEQGLVRVTALANPFLAGRGDAFLARITCSPEHLSQIAQWLAHRPESLWVTTLMTSSAVVGEFFLHQGNRTSFIEQDLKDLPIQDFSFAPIHHYGRTVRGWQPEILDAEQLAHIGEDESSALTAASNHPVELDPVDQQIVSLLEQDGRMSIEAISSKLGTAKATVRKHISLLQQSDRVSIRAVLDPAILGYPYEVFVSVRPRFGGSAAVTTLLAADRRSRWVAETSVDGSVYALLAFADRDDVPSMLNTLAMHLTDEDPRVTVEPLLTMYKRSDILLPPAAPGDAQAES
ncbi:Lrp/AsnC family transcriptional regulator [Leucobacter coleopterorum]|uniref:Lrp/AsnC family transcriptional regulator n=1 Tax=Leucobacter coleopterorum TaxID=2714933 RepID=A0ABX6JU96_9MICO|nr:AsnC family transcriptional regulator [Leucobacter coleopterorum]QIM17871.1 Lrp/AsnC family transcriptional regulator [Leucobacter coleopterorum]